MGIVQADVTSPGITRQPYMLEYFAAREYGREIFTAHERFDLENAPRSEWPVRNGQDSRAHIHDLVAGLFTPPNNETWAEWNFHW